MQIKFHSTGESVHISKEGAAPLIASGFAEEVKPAPPVVKFTPQTEWSVQRAIANGEPRIVGHCHSKTCGRQHVVYATGGMPHVKQKRDELTGEVREVTLTPTLSKVYKTTKFWHCGVGESIPAHIQDEFKAAFADYLAGNKVDTRS